MNFRKDRNRRAIAALEVTPLVDIVFLLLIFFLLTATYVKNPNLDIDLPKASLSQTINDKRDVTVAIKSDGEIRYDNTEISLESLEGVLRAQFAESQEAVVVIRADEGTRHGRVVEVMDLAKRVGFAKLAIAVQARGGDGQ